MQHTQPNWGRPRDDIYGPYDAKIHNAPSALGPSSHTQQPVVTGTSVLALKFDQGVVLSADTLASYGSLARFTDQQRLIQVGKYTVVGISGDISDLQYVERLLESLVIRENYENEDSAITLRANHVFAYLSRVYYGRRSKVDPLWNSVVVAGVDDKNEFFLSYVDLLGVTYSSPAIATGFGAHLAIPLMRRVVDKDGDQNKLSAEAARKLIDQCMKVLFYRDARSLDRYTVATVTREGIAFERDVKCEAMSWGFAKDVRGYGQDQQ